MSKRLAYSAAALACAAAMISAPASAQDADKCAALANLTIAPTEIGLPNGGVQIRTAHLDRVAANPDLPGDDLHEYCLVLGAILPVDPAAPPVNFEINLPLQWNGKALQYGGGGTNGVQIHGVERLRDARGDTPVPVARGFATWGTDAGHDNEQLPEPHAFALNREALLNMAYAAYKKTHDVGRRVATVFYGRAPSKMYFYGGSEGGREALVMAQRYPADFDAIFSAVPVLNYTGIYLASAPFFALEQKGGWMNPQKVRVLKNAINAACDSLDGLADGVISAYEKCLSVFDSKIIRCAGGADTGDNCLSDAQIAADRLVHRPFAYPFPLANGITSFPGWTYGSEDQPGGMIDSITGRAPPKFPLDTEKGQPVRWVNYSGFVRYYIAQDPNFNPLTFSPEKFRDRLIELSQLFDATNPDLSAFANRGGKLIIKGNGADYQRAVMQEITYYKAVVAKMGQARADQFIRFYVTPGVNHPGNGLLASGEPVPAKVDLLGVLDDWADGGKAPGTLTQVTLARGRFATPPFAVSGPDCPSCSVRVPDELLPLSVAASRPMCLYPRSPRYDGTGDPKQASSFSCTAE